LTPRVGKRAIILDFVGNVFTHGMPTEKRIYTLINTIKIKNSSREPDIIARECNNCLRVYKGTSPICPYCGFNNGKTQKEMEQDKKTELERIAEINKNNARREVGMAKTEAELIEIGKRRGYKNPRYWARTILTARNNKIKKI